MRGITYNSLRWPVFIFRKVTRISLISQSRLLRQLLPSSRSYSSKIASGRRAPLQLFSGVVTECKIAEYQFELAQAGNAVNPVSNS